MSTDQGQLPPLLAANRDAVELMEAFAFGGITWDQIVAEHGLLVLALLLMLGTASGKISLLSGEDLIALLRADLEHRLHGEPNGQAMKGADL